MNKITHPIYQDYAEQPYISPERDLELWIKKPSKFPYAVVEKKKMIRLAEGILPGDFIMLWRIGFHTFTTDSTIPQYFEYRYGVDAQASIDLLLKLGFAYQCSATESLDSLNAGEVKEILSEYDLKTTGKKADLVERVIENIPEAKLQNDFELRRYDITKSGQAVLDKYPDLIKQHGPKM